MCFVTVSVVALQWKGGKALQLLFVCIPDVEIYKQTDRRVSICVLLEAAWRFTVLALQPNPSHKTSHYHAARCLPRIQRGVRTRTNIHTCITAHIYSHRVSPLSATARSCVGKCSEKKDVLCMLLLLLRCKIKSEFTSVLQCGFTDIPYRSIATSPLSKIHT